MREDAGFGAEVEAARSEGGRSLEDELVRRATSGDTTALIFALKAWNRARYGDRQHVEHSGEGGGPMILVHRVQQG